MKNFVFMKNLVFTAEWIEYPGDDRSLSPIFAADFSFDKEKYESAALYISGLGLFEVTVNGKKPEDTVFDPGESVFGKRVYAVCYDVFHMLSDGVNAIGIMLGNGQYENFRVNPTMEADGKPIPPHRYQKNDGAVYSRGIYGTKKLVAEIRATTRTGEEHVILASGDGWRATAGPIVFNDWYGGEDYDATLEIGGWDLPSADRSGWQNAAVTSAPADTVTLRGFTPIKVCEVTPAVSVTETDTGTYIVDFGKNGAGVPEITVEATAAMRGTKIKMKPAEELDEKGHADQRSSTQSWSAFKSCEISDSYTVKGTGREVWRPRFCYHGFRYLEVESFPYPPTTESFGYCRIRTANGKNGTVTTDSPVINRINEITERSIESNMFGAFTDCPQIEKLGWLETSHLMFRSMAYGYDIRNWIPKIVRDICDSQVKEGDKDVESVGYVPAIAPEYHRIVGLHRDPNWGGAVVLTPWNYYVFYNDDSLIRMAYPSMKAYLVHLAGFEKDGLIEGYAQMGDWGQINESTPTKLVENCAYYNLVTTVSKVAAVLGYDNESALYKSKAAEIKAAFHRDPVCFDSASGTYGNGSQSSCGCVLWSGIVAEENEAATVEALVSAVERSGYHLTSGEVGLRQVFGALDKYGRNDVVYKMIMNPTPPGYRYFIDKGLTALPEYWNYEELWWGMVRSRNHAMMGHVKQWLTEGLLGVKPVGDSYGSLLIEPFVPDDVKRAEGSFVCGYGCVSVSWNVLSEGVISVKYTAPEGVSVTVKAPRGYTLAE